MTTGEETTGPSTSSSPSSKHGTAFAVESSKRAERDLEAEATAWMQLHGSAPSKLGSDLANAREALAEHPYLGQRYRRLRKLLLRETGYFLIYEVFPRKRLIRIHGLAYKGRFARR